MCCTKLRECLSVSVAGCCTYCVSDAGYAVQIVWMGLNVLYELC